MLKGQKKGERSGVLITCPCGNVFYRWNCKAARSKTCSKKCFYKYRSPRPTGLVYKIIAENKAWFKSGEPSKYPRPKGIIPKNFKGDAVGYDALHDWVKRHYGKATKCEHCGTTAGRIHWANRTWEYKRNISDWLQLCAKCHQKYDRANAWGVATAKFPEMRRRA